MDEDVDAAAGAVRREGRDRSGDITSDPTQSSGNSRGRGEDAGVRELGDEQLEALREHRESAGRIPRVVFGGMTADLCELER